MPRWTFGQKLGLGFAAVLLLALLISAVGVYTLQSVSTDWERVLSIYATNVADARKLETTSLRRISANRAYLLSKNEQFRKQSHDERDNAEKLLSELQRHIKAAGTAQDQDLLNRITDLSRAQAAAADSIMAARDATGDFEAISRQFQDQVVPRNQEFQNLAETFVQSQQKRLDDMNRAATHAASVATWLLIGIASAGVILAAIVAYVLSRMLSRQIGSAVQHIQSSSTQLQSAANQQTAGSKEQVASMTEISTTIKELLSTAKQIAGSAQRVTHIAEESAGAAHSGDGTVQKAQTDVSGIRQQVDQIVTHMLDLGRKSQQIGGILEIINELAEQTNILAINATIEAAGAGETGRRFSVVADEIRKLADRVGGSTKEIRALIEEIRAAVNTTVMATESGSKAVDLGVRQFSEVAGAFRRIVDLLGTTTEAAREIELSTKQQSTAVEQVNLAVANVAQAARESEASSSQILQTVGELTSLSRDLARLVQSPSLNGRGNGRAVVRVEHA